MFKLTEEEAHDYFVEDYDEETSPFEVIETDDWDVGHKEDSCTVILLHKESGKTYGFGASRWGSHWDGYDFTYDGLDPLQEVHQVEITTTEWRYV